MFSVQFSWLVMHHWGLCCGIIHVDTMNRMSSAFSIVGVIIEEGRCGLASWMLSLRHVRPKHCNMGQLHVL